MENTEDLKIMAYSGRLQTLLDICQDCINLDKAMTVQEMFKKFTLQNYNCLRTEDSNSIRIKEVYNHDL
jgi:hypothetical protein